MPSIIRDHPVNSIINSDYLKKRKLANEEIIELEDYHHFDNIRRYLEDLAERYPTCVSRCGGKNYHATVAKSLKRLGLHAVLLHTSWSLES